MAIPKISRTFGPIHFEDLDPHRFGIFPNVHHIGAFRAEIADMCLMTEAVPHRLDCKKEDFNMLYVKLYSLISRSVGYFIISVSGLLYVQRILSEPADRVIPLALTAIATIAALSALCFSYVPCISDEVDKNSGLYAGEKFLHSTLLMIQTLFLKYVADQLLAIDSIKEILWLQMTISITVGVLLFGIGGYAVTMAALGFDSLNKTLWSHFEKLALKNLRNI
jgi:hypothetical protein